MPHKRLIVVGGGAAGFFCAVNAARLNPKLQVVLLEKSGKLLSKVKVSGGGRCNVTHACFDITEMCKRYPRGTHFVKKSFHRFFTPDTIQWFKERKVELKTEADGRMFPVTDSSQTIINCLLDEAARYNVDVRLNADVKNFKKTPNGWLVETAKGEQLTGSHICIACGGYPKLSMFEWLTSSGHTIEEPMPSLFTFNIPHHPITKLMGIVGERVNIKIAGSKLIETGPVLITHWGLSGPAVLRLSAWGARELAVANYQFTVIINWLIDYNDQTLKKGFQSLRTSNPSKKIFNYNPGQLPHRLWQFLLAQSGVKDEIRFADLPARLENILIKNLVNYTVEIKGKTTFKEEFVTAGGIKLNEVDAQTMMSRKIPDLYFAGEILDVDGITGGYNFQHAWTSGWIAANEIAKAN
ncbi:MAG TPA: NAD(P)/FAD-dependent oxidoreductase [Chitinophagaceae bacterium]